MQVNHNLGMLYAMSKHEYVYLFDVETGAFIYKNRISLTNIFTFALLTGQQGIIGVNFSGQVLLVTFIENSLVPFI